MKTEEDLFTMRYTSFKRIMPIPAHADSKNWTLSVFVNLENRHDFNP